MKIDWIATIGHAVAVAAFSAFAIAVLLVMRQLKDVNSSQ